MDEFTHVEFEELDVEEHEDEAAEYGVRGVPCTVFVNEKGEMVDKLAGLQTEDALVKKIREVFRHVADRYRQKPSIVLRGIDGGERLICVDDILYIEVFGAELDVHCKRGVVHCSGTLIETGSLLSSKDFYRCHRSYIVNLRYATGVERYQFRMVTGDTVAVAKNRYAEVKAAFEAYVGAKRRR